MRRSLFLVLAVVCIAAVFAGVFAGCNNGDGNGGGGNGSGAGDKIFTEGATLEDIITALENAESVTITQHYKHVGTNNEGKAYVDDSIRQYKFDVNNGGSSFMDYLIYQEDGVTDVIESHINRMYSYFSGDVIYTTTVYYDADGKIEGHRAEKCLADILPSSSSSVGQEAVKWLEALTTDADGNIVLNDRVIMEGFESYVEGSGYVRLNGSSIEFGWEEEYSNEYDQQKSDYKITLSGVNATTVDIPAEVRALEAEAEWADSVYYNGVSYEKETDENGEEYYFVRHAEEDAVIEETINTLPVRER